MNFTADPADRLLQSVLDLSLTGIILFRPVYGAPDDAATIVDLAYEHLNPAAQRMLQLPERPAATFLTLYPNARETGIFAFYRDTFLTGEAGHYNVNYQHDGLDNYFRLAARRSGDQLLVSFTDTGDQPRTAVEEELRRAQAELHTARAAAEAQRQQLQDVLQQAPVAIALLEGPEYRITLANPAVCEIWARTQSQLLGRPLLLALPELQGQGIDALLNGVLHSGQPYTGTELPVQLQRHGQLETIYFNFVYQPQHNAAGATTGVLVVATDVTQHVLARLHVQELNEELATTNEEIQASNEEFLANNAELTHTQFLLQQLNQELEARVRDRTKQLHVALSETEQQRTRLQLEQGRLQQILGQVPAFIATLDGPDHRYTFFNDAYLALTGGRAHLGLSVAQALPEFGEQGIIGLLDQVYATGRAFSGTDKPIRLLPAATGQPELHYVDFVYQPLFDERNQTQGILAFIVDVTDKVLARQEAEMLQSKVLLASQQQAQQRETFYQIFEQTPALIQLLRAPQHRVEYVNPAYQRLFSGRTMVGRDLAEALPEAQEQGFISLLDHVYATGETYVGAEVPLTWTSGENPSAQASYFNFTYQAFRENGQIAGISVFAYDVTGQVLARRQREAERERLQRLFMEAPAAICILAGPELVFELVNPQYQRLLPDRPLLGKTFLEAVPELAQHSVMSIFRQIYETGVTHEESAMLVPLTRPDGVLEDRYFNYIQQARRDEQGRIDGVLVFAFEVTEQVRARQASEASAQQLRLLTDSLPVLIGYLDHELKYRFANHAYKAWFNQNPEELLGRPVREVVGEQAFANAWPYMERALAGERLDFEARMPYREGFTKHIRTSYVPDVRQGAVVGFYTLVSDVTEQVEARQRAEASAQQALELAGELHQTNEQLTRTNVDLDNFIYTASHDLKAPITNIEGLLDMLRHELPPGAMAGEVAHILDLMHNSVDRFKRTIEHLTTVSRLQKEHDQPVAQVQLAAVIDNVRLDLAPLLRQTSGTLDVDVRQCPPLLFSEKNLRSVVYNLLSNALKYHHPERPPLVRVRTEVDGAFVVLHVHDNGLGLDLERKDQLFAMFQRLHTHVEGSGIGLYMVKRIMENAGGRITVRSQVGEGTTFSAYFPH
ncbi:PAS domain-containing protein [Hymenobacter sp. BT635]|uniref:histidine kinase n=1 Tax=Hymenobacter nitidus TaxID=2880929 RepID=A0ABS8ABA9_9BACT|nr:PAS domain-containing protein [Hymenobacter nitidus]MCB2376684.1 PAS domain-containing protein [Hymenobacter nitidus]